MQTDLNYMSAVTTNRDTFKVTQVLLIPGHFTHMALLAMEDSGVLMIDIETKTVIAEFNVYDMNPFHE